VDAISKLLTRSNGRDDIVEEVNQEWAKRIAAKSTTPEDLPGAAGVPMDMVSTARRPVTG